MTEKILRFDKSKGPTIITAEKVTGISSWDAGKRLNKIEELEKELKAQVDTNEANPTYNGCLAIANIHNKLGKKYFYKSDFNKAVFHYKKVLYYKDKACFYTTDQLGIQLGIVDTYEKLSEIYRDNSHFKKADEYTELAINTRKKAINALIE